MPPCVAKTCAVHLVFATVVAGEMVVADPRMLERAMKQMLVQGHTLRLLDAAREPGTRTVSTGAKGGAWIGGVGLRPGRPFTGVSGPSGPGIPKKPQKECFWGSAKKSPKIPEKVEKCPKKSNFGSFSTFSGIFGDFFADPQKHSF